MSAPAAETMTVQEYLELEKTAEVRHEYVDGQYLAMAGEKIRHNQITGRIYALLLETAMAKGCQIVFESVKLRTTDTRYRYPDVVVSCAPSADEYVIENPCLIVEVLSESTAHTDLETKLAEYTRLPSLDRYVIVSQRTRNVIVYRRTPDGWAVDILENGEIEIPCLETRLTLEQIYAGIELGTREKSE